MWLVPRKVYSISVDPLDDLTECFTAIWKRFLTLESFPEFSSQYVSLGNVKMIVSLPWDCLQHNKPLSINNRIKRGNRERHGSDVHICRFEALSHAAGGGREVKKVKNQAPGVEGQGGWGSQTRSLEWWRSLTSVCVHAAGQLFAGQRCAAVLHCPWTPSDSVWTVRCWLQECSWTDSASAASSPSPARPGSPPVPCSGRLVLVG